MGTLEIFKLDCGRYPTLEEGLEALIANPGIEGWKGPYTRQAITDTWGQCYLYLYDNSKQIIISSGIDKVMYTDDDVFIDRKTNDIVDTNNNKPVQNSL